jgi:hypothetical protein
MGSTREESMQVLELEQQLRLIFPGLKGGKENRAALQNSNFPSTFPSEVAVFFHDIRRPGIGG